MDATTGLVTVLVALIAAVAALVGSRLTAQSNSKTLEQASGLERERWQREDRNRHEETRRTAYPQFLATVDEGVHRVNAVLERRMHAETLPDHEWRERERVALSVIEFVGTSEAIDTAIRLDRAARRLVTGATGLVSAALADEGFEHTHEHAHGDVDDDPADPPADDVLLSEGDWAEEDELPDWPEGEAPPRLSDEEAEARAAEFIHGRLIDEEDPISFLNILPYPLGDDPNQERMYGGDPLLQISMARGELRVRRHEFVNAARADLGMDLLPYPDQPKDNDESSNDEPDESRPPEAPAG
jgi:hypothetical protein